MKEMDRIAARLLDPRVDPAPVEYVAATARPDLLFICEHAGRLIPRSLGDLGLAPGEIDRHIAWDIGAEGVARRLAATLGAGLILQRYSRLVIDCNRPPLGKQSIPETSDGAEIPGNRNLSNEAGAARVVEIFRPFAEACEAAISDRRIRGAYSIHSFTPCMNGFARPWHIGFCFRQANSGGDLARRFGAAHPNLTVAENQPYQIDDETDWFIPRVAEPRGIAHALIEIRNDQIADEAGQILWAGRLAALFQPRKETDL